MGRKRRDQPLFDRPRRRTRHRSAGFRATLACRSMGIRRRRQRPDDFRTVPQSQSRRGRPGYNGINTLIDRTLPTRKSTRLRAPSMSRSGRREEPETLDLVASASSAPFLATGFTPDWSYVRLPIFDGSGYPVNRRGVTSVPGVFCWASVALDLGIRALPKRWPRRRNSLSSTGFRRSAWSPRLEPPRQLALAVVSTANTSDRRYRPSLNAGRVTARHGRALCCS